MRYILIALTFLGAATPAVAAKITCTHNDMYGFLGEFDLETTGPDFDFEIVLPASSVHAEGVPDGESGLVSIKGRFEECYSDKDDPLLVSCHLERSPLRVTRPDGTAFEARAVINLSVVEETVRGSGGTSVSHVGGLQFSGSSVSVKEEYRRIDFGSPSNKPARKGDFCVAR